MIDRLGIAASRITGKIRQLEQLDPLHGSCRDCTMEAERLRKEATEIYEQLPTKPRRAVIAAVGQRLHTGG